MVRPAEGFGVVDMSKPMTQANFGAIVGVSQQAISDLCKRGVLSDGGCAGEWLQDYCLHLREVAAGRLGDTDADLVTERALLAREQRVKIEMQNAVTRGELAPRQVLIDVLAMTAPKVCGVLEGIVPALRRRSGYSAADLDFIKEQIALARNEIASMRLPDIKAKTDQADDMIEDID